MNPNYATKVKEEIDSLLKAGFIAEVESSDWLFQIVVVPKKNDTMLDQVMDQGDLVLWYPRNLDTRKKSLAVRWSGSYVIFKIYRNGSVKLRDLKGMLLSNPVNKSNLTKYPRNLESQEYSKGPHDEQKRESQEFSELLEEKEEGSQKNPEGQEVVVTPKKNGKWRVCVDYKPLSAATKRDHFPLPFQDDILNEVVVHERYTVCDGYSGYYQIRIAEENQHKTTFITPWGCFAFRVMPFGLTNAPSTFTRFTSFIFQPFIGKSIRVFLDDFCTYSDRALHCQRVEEGLQRLYQYGGQLNPDKCHVAEKEVVLLEHVISQEGIKVDPSRVQAVLDLPPPNSARQVITFVQKVRYMSRFIHLLSQIISPLQQLANQEVFSWEQEHLECFNEVKEVLGSLPTIMPPDPQGIYYLCPSVGLDAFGAVLMQKDPKTAYMRPIYFTSKVMTQGQKGYTDIEQLVFSLIVAIRKFRSYLLPKPFIIFTLEHNLPYAIQHMSISSKISKWVLELQEYEYTFIVEDSTRASLADVLTYKVKKKKITPKAQVKLDLSPQGELEDAYTLLFDGAYCRQSNKAAGGFVIFNEEKKEVLKKGIQLHLAHSNNEAEYATLKAGLEECKSMGIRRLMVKGDALLIVRQDHYMTRWAEAASVARITAADVSKFVLDYICSRFGTPLEILSDRGPGFRADLLDALFENLSIKHVHSTPYYPQCNGLVEKTNGVLCKIITKHVRDRPQDWDKHLTAALWAYRTSFKVSTQFMPYHLVYGQESLLPIEVELGSLRVLARETTSSKEKLEQRFLDLQRLELDRETATDYYITQANKKREQFNNKIKEKKLEEGMLVMRYDIRLDLSHSKKFFQRCEGPYVIFKKFKNGSYRLQDLSGKIRKYPVNGWRLKEFFQRIQPIKEERQVSLDA
ncbi:hypothetical protein L7F22_064006 [Adiantum nelumboides]|nr:hypothetical protein [Adiantum nelumboides]